VGLARAIALEPEILLFDEPTTGPDPVTSQVIDDLMVKTTRKLQASALIISHNVHAALHMADCVSMISEGKIIESASPGAFVRTGVEKVRHFLKSAGVV
jgi:phospholipid/cholesterol/gamma-HCH transport system ATP-binding protein